MQLFFDHLAGLSGAAAEQDACAEVVRLVIAGESTHPLPPPAARAGKKVGSSPCMPTRKSYVPGFKHGMDPVCLFEST